MRPAWRPRRIGDRALAAFAERPAVGGGLAPKPNNLRGFERQIAASFELPTFLVFFLSNPGLTAPEALVMVTLR